MRKNIRIAVVMLLVLALATAGVSFAWFMENMEIKVSSGDNMNISVGGDLQVKWHDDPEGTWGSQLKGSVKNITMLDCSGNGLKFFTGDVDDAGKPHSMYEIEKDKFKGSVLEVAVDLRTSHKMDVYLGSLSSVSPVIGAYVDLEQNPDADHNNSLSGGEFSADWIAAAARVAFIEVVTDEGGNITEELKFIWVPNADDKLGTDDNGKYIFTENGAEIETEYTYCSGIGTADMPETTIETYDKASLTNIFVPAQGDQLCTSDNQDGADAANLSPKIVSFTEEGKLQEKQIIIRIWFEGYDNECTAAMVGGKVNYTFSFAGMLARTELTYAEKTGFDATNIVATENAESGYTLTIPEGLKDKIIYSTNGFDYSDYTEGTPITGVTEVYLRIKETKSTYASNILKIDLAPQGGGQ